MRASGGLFFDAPPTNLWFNTLNQDGSNRIRSASISGCNTVAPCTPAAGAPAFPSVANLTPTGAGCSHGHAGLQERVHGERQPADFARAEPQRRRVGRLRVHLRPQLDVPAEYEPHQSHRDTGRRAPDLLLRRERLHALVPAVQQHYAAGRRRHLQLSTRCSSTGITGCRGVCRSRRPTPSPTPSAMRRKRTPSSRTCPSRTRPIFSATAAGRAWIGRTPLPSAPCSTRKSKLENRFLNRLLNDNMFAILANLCSGDPQNILANTTLNGDATTGSVTRPLFVGRNTARTPNIYQVDLRYTRAFARFWERVTPQFIFEANNVFNHPNVTSINSTATVNTNPALGQVGAITTPPSLLPSGTVLEGPHHPVRTRRTLVTSDRSGRADARKLRGRCVSRYHDFQLSMKSPKPSEAPFPAPVYAETVLAVNFEDAKRYFLEALLEIHYAHTLMLARQRHSRSAGCASLPAFARRTGPSRHQRRRLRRQLRGPVLLSRGTTWQRAAERKSPAGCIPRAAATTST